MLRNLFIVIALLLTTVSCNNSIFGQTSFQKKPSSQPQGNPSYLMVILSDYGVIQQTSQGSYQLIVDSRDFNNVLAFTNRPYRLVKQMSGQQLEALWTQGGAKSFANDPPNATVVINQKTQTVTLMSVQMQGTKMIFGIQPDGTTSIIPMGGECQLFIDSTSSVDDINVCSVVFGRNNCNG